MILVNIESFMTLLYTSPLLQLGMHRGEVQEWLVEPNEILASIHARKDEEAEERSDTGRGQFIRHQRFCYTLGVHYGEVQEWLNWPLSKSGIAQAIEGSNPSLSAIEKHPCIGVFFYGAFLRPSSNLLSTQCLKLSLGRLAGVKRPLAPPEKVPFHYPKKSRRGKSQKIRQRDFFWWRRRV